MANNEEQQVQLLLALCAVQILGYVDYPSLEESI
jgi:hypothetical protein